MAFKNSTVFDCPVIDMAKIHADNGNITFIENGNNISWNLLFNSFIYKFIW